MTRPSLITVAALLLAPCAATAQSFTAADGNGDISRGEASSNPDLVREFHVVDRDHDGRLTREELKGWLD